MPKSPTTKAAPRPDMTEIGVAGLKQYSGIIHEEFLRQLSGGKAIKVYREMSENDSIIGAVLRAIGLMIRAVDWNVEPADSQSSEAEVAAEFVRSLTTDMSTTWEDFIGECLSFLVYGWSYFETVLKRRVGPDEADPSKRSAYTDGKIGVRKLAIRSQETLSNWKLQDDGGIEGMVQQPPMGGGSRFLPIERCLLFRTESRRGSPEGVSVLRTAYRSWYFLKIVQEAEAIGIERDLAGLPVAYIPAKHLSSSASAADKAVLALYQQIVRDVKYNEQGGLVLPSDVYSNPDGTLSNVPQVKLELLSTGGRRQIDTNATVLRYQRDMARSVLADFIMLGTDGKGSYALSTDKTDLFLRACETYLAQIAAPLNRFLLPRIWAYNGFPRETMPQLVPGKVAPQDLGELGTYIDALAQAGAPLFPDPALEAWSREVAGLPAAESTAAG